MNPPTLKAKTPTIEMIHKHRSIRAYKSDSVPREMLGTIVAAGQRSSTSSNMQLTSVIAVTDPAKRERLAELCGNQEHIRQAPVFLAWCADRARLDRVCAARGYTQAVHTVESFLTAAVDVAIMMQTAALAAESLGLGMCYIGAIRNNPREIIELLNLPKHVFPISGMTLGWPNADPILRPRLPMDTVLHWEEYNPDDAEELQTYDQAMIETGIYRGRTPAVRDQPEQVEDYGWLEHTARQVAQPVRAHLREILREQDFALE